MTEQKSTTFGPNAGLVDEMYERYRSDPSSVAESWRDFFADYGDGDGKTPEAPAEAPKPEAPKANKAEAPKAEKRQSEKKQPTEKQPEKKQPEEEPAEAADAGQPIRGAAARIVANMEASLAVPTATSVRTVPARLLEVNRKVLNGYLGRTGQGKVSFTHLIGFAVLKAVPAVPAMNSTFTREDDRPEVVRQHHVGLGLAVDVEKKDGSRTLLVPFIKNADT